MNRSFALKVTGSDGLPRSLATHSRKEVLANPSQPVTIGLLEALSEALDNHHLPAWARIWAWALANADEYGHARAYPGELRHALGDVDSREVSRAIRLARERRLIERCSNAGCLVLPGYAPAPCSAHHRGDL